MHSTTHFRSKVRTLTTGLLVALLAGLTSAHAEDAIVDLEFRVFSLNRDVIHGLYYRAEGDAIAPIKFFSRRRSAPHPYRGPQVISFYREVEGAVEGEPPYEVVGSVNIRPGTKEPLFFFLPLRANNSADENEFRILAMDDSPESFPPGHVRVLNASGAPLSGQVGDQDIRLGFELSPAWPSRSLFSREGNWVNLALFVQVRDDYEMVYANQLTFASNARSILVVRPPRRENSLRVITYILEDYRRAEQTAQAGTR